MGISISMFMLKEKLEDLGLSSSEIDVYLSLLQMGPSQAGVISKSTKLNRTSTYQVIERLIRKGLVNYINKGKLKVFQAVSPKRLLSLQEEKVNLAKELISELDGLAHKSEEEATIYKGRNGIRTIMQDILGSKEYVSFGSAGQFLDIMKHDFLLFQKEKRKRGIKSRVIVGDSSKNNEVVMNAYAKFRFVNDKYMTPTTTWVYGDTVAIVVWSSTPFATLIKSKEASDAYRNYFELLWVGAKK